MIVAQGQAGKVKFMNDYLTPGEANDLVSELLDKYINFYKILYMSRWEHNRISDQEIYDQRINDLEEKKQEFKVMISEARATGSNVSIDGILEFKLAKEI